MPSSVFAEPVHYLAARIRWRPVEIVFWLATLLPFVLTPEGEAVASRRKG